MAQHLIDRVQEYWGFKKFGHNLGCSEICFLFKTYVHNFLKIPIFFLGEERWAEISAFLQDSGNLFRYFCSSRQTLDIQHCSEMSAHSQPNVIRCASRHESRR